VKVFPPSRQGESFAQPAESTHGTSEIWHREQFRCWSVVRFRVNASSRASVLETLLTALTRLVLQTATYRRQRRSWYGGVFLLLLLQQRSKHPREMVITPKASTSHLLRFKSSPGVNRPPPLVFFWIRRLTFHCALC